MFFANEQRDNVRDENPNITFGKGNPDSLLQYINHLTGQVGKVLGERWKALSESERRPYEDKAKADKERYDAEKASYQVSATHRRVRNGLMLCVGRRKRGRRR